MDPTTLARIERMNYLLGAILIAVVAVVVRDSVQTLGAAIGAVLSAFNFSVVRRIVERVGRAPDGQKARPTLVFLPKMMLLMLAVAAAIVLLPSAAVMVAVGFSIFLVSIAIETVRFIVSGPRGGAGDGTGEQRHG